MIQIKLALRYLIHKPITLFAVISVLLGTTAFVVVIGVMDGYVTAFNEHSRKVLSDMVVHPGGYVLTDPDKVADVIKTRVDDVVECSPNISGRAVAKIRGTDGKFSLRWCQFVGVDAPLELKVTGLDALKDVPPDTDDWIVPGRELLGTRSVEDVSEIVLVTSGRTGTSPPLKAKVRLASVVDFGLYMYDKEFAYISRKQAAALTGLPPTDATELRVRIRNPRHAERVRQDIQTALDDYTGAVVRRQVYRALDRVALDPDQAEDVRNEIQAAVDDFKGDAPGAEDFRRRTRLALRQLKDGTGPAEDAWREIRNALYDFTRLGLRVYRYQETSAMFRALKLQRNLAMVPLGVLFAAAGFAVVAICYMIVLQKTRDIGVLRTIGLSRGGVMGSFVVYGVVAGLAGVVLGMALGVFVLDRMAWVRQTLTGLLGHDPFPATLYSLREVPHEVNPWVLVGIAVVALVVSFLGSLYPAYRAARVNVVESLRYE